MTSTKSPFSSLTINAALVALVVQMLAIFGIEIEPKLAADIGASINSLIAAIALLVTIYGRFRARKAIGSADQTILRTPYLVAVAVAATLLLAACSTSDQLPVIGPNQAPAPAPAPALASMDLADAAAAGVQYRTEAAIETGVLHGRSADDALDRANQVAAAIEIAHATAKTFGIDAASARIGAALHLAAAAQRMLPVVFERQ